MMTTATAPTTAPATDTNADDAELERLTAWFIQNRADIAKAFFVDAVECVEGRVIGVKRTINNRGQVRVKERELV